MEAGRLRDSYGGYRAQLVERLVANGIHDMAVLAAFGKTARHLFVPDALRHRAYEDTALPIGNRQTISQPTTHARYLEALALTGHERVLEIGTGSGFQSALLGFLCDQVVSLERIAELATAARRAIEASGCHNVMVAVADGTLGWGPLAPYDAILVGAVAPKIPRPLLGQLADGGRLVLPVEREGGQTLLRITRHGDEYAEDVLGDARFVPLFGRHGFDSPEGD